MLTTLLPPSTGEAWVAGFDVLHQAAQVRQRIGYVPQMLSADPDLSGYENLLIFAKLYRVPASLRRVRIKEALAFMGIAEAAHALVRHYSGGMIRRLEIAQSLVNRPEVLFLDEPTVERFMGVGQLLTMPLFFASNAIYPVALMPSWLAAIARLNPLTYLVDALRALMLVGWQSTLGLGTDLAVLSIVLAVLVAVAARLYPIILG